MNAATRSLPPTSDEYIQCYNRAGASSAAGRHDEALGWYDRAIGLKPGFAEAHNNRGLLLAGFGRHREAVDAFLNALESRPGYARALNNLGLSQLALGEPVQALACFDSALRAQPDYFAAIANRAEAQYELGEYAAAAQSYEQALRMNPASWKVLLGLGRTNHASGDAVLAARWFSEAVRVLGNARLAAATPDATLDIALGEALQGADRGDEAVQVLEIAAAANRRADLFAALGIALTRSGDSPRAQASFEQALRADPRNLDALCGLAALKQRQDEVTAAIALYERALVVRPRRADLHYRKGNLQQQSGQHEAAVDALMTAVSLRPRYQDALMACSASLAALRRHDEAVGCLDEVLKIDPRHVPAMNKWGTVLADMGAYEPALEQYERALAVDPRAYAVLCNHGVASMTLNRSALAIESFRRAAEVAASQGLPGAEIAAVKARLLDAVAAACDWEDYEALRNAALAALREGLALSPFVAITFADDPALHLAVAQQYGERQYPLVTPAAWVGRHAHDRIRVAYLSADLHDHATAYLMAGLFEQHDRKRFEITTVSFGPDDQNSSWRQRIRAASERFIEASSLGDAQVAAQLAELGIDIAVDLKGYTLGCRTGILARRPAPVQVNYLGFPGSMGLPCIDYIIADHELVPAYARAHYSEKVVRLPGCYQVNDDRRPTIADASSRHSQGLPAGAMVFCSFNASYKITPELFAVWMRILERTSGSVLWQLQRDAAVRDNLRRQAARHGVDPQRLLFAETVPVTEHLARIACADLFLDTLPVNAHTTASDALWAGVPIITQRGRSFAGRVCSSLLHAVDLAELVVDSTAAYEELAVALATDRNRLAALRARAAAARQAPLFDTLRTTRHIEAAFHAMWQRHQAGQSPEHFDVQPILPS